jgi:hypothetical protein
VVKEAEKKERSKESYPLKEKIKEDRSTKKMDRGQLSKQKNPSTMLWSTSRKRRKNRLAKPLKMGQVGPRVLTPRVLDLGF